MSTGRAAISRPAPKTERGVRTRAALLRAAERCFGDRGFHAVSVNDITEEAGIAIGTFYLYFTDKLEVFRAVVDLIQAELRVHLRSSDAEDRLLRERQGLSSFLAFACERPKMFRILQESYIVDADIYFSYFEGIAASYAKRLKAAQKRKQIVERDADIQAWCLIAISNFLGMRYSRPAMRKAKLDAVVETAADFIAFGLAREGSGRSRPVARRSGETGRM
ncbi:MAG: TetR/AcrR family transcriptional regulator [Bradyrhizobium sp.]|nr:TetR/AcrR family transcriptional regulator [Bradyrhizobium sp.]